MPHLLCYPVNYKAYCAERSVPCLHRVSDVILATIVNTAMFGGIGLLVRPGSIKLQQDGWDLRALSAQRGLKIVIEEKGSIQ